MKHFKQILLTVLVALASTLPASAYDFEVDGIFYNILSVEEKKCEVTYEKCIYLGNPGIVSSPYSGEIVIPSIAKGYSVTSIGESAFMYCYGLTSVIIPNTVISIGNYAFRECTRLSSVIIPNSITSIGEDAFCFCNNLLSIELPNTVASIGSGAFFNCSKLATIVIPVSVKRLGTEVLAGCNNLKEIVSLNPTPPQAYYNTFELVSKTDCTVKVAEEAVAAYKAANYWREFQNIVALYKGTCEAPTISILGGKLYFECATEGAEVEYSIASEDFRTGISNNNTLVPISGLYTITAYAKAKDFAPSDTITANLVWVNPALEGSNIINMEAKKAVLIRSNGNCLQISGTERGERIEVYNLGGMLLSSSIADNGESELPCNARKGETLMVKYGDKAVKVKL